MNEPKRLFESAEPALREALAELKADVPSAAHFDAMAARVLSLTAPSGGDGGGDGGRGQGTGDAATDAGGSGGGATGLAGEIARGAALKLGLSTKLALTGFAVAVAVSGVAFVRDEGPAMRPPRPAVSVTVQVAAPVTSAQPDASPLTSPGLVVSAESAATAPAAPTKLNPSQAPTRDLAAETELLSRAQGRLARDPQGTVALCAEHRRRYPDGALREERDVLEVDALIRAGDVEKARRAGARFLRAHPDSSHARRVRDLVEAL
ncbi:MAG: hypothetical protein IPG50_18175 [Myxococcales bacterium]|nr:hypothetical protein [Myxococcales bacterium]